MLVLYYGYIAIVAFAPASSRSKSPARSPSASCLGVALILISILLTGIYVLRANSRYDDLTQAIVEAALGRPQVKPRSHRRPGARARSGAGPASPPADRADAQPIDWNAIFIFAAFVLLTLGITYWAAQRTRTAKDFYAAGGGITGFQNGLAIAGDYMSAASFLGISALCSSSAITA